MAPRSKTLLLLSLILSLSLWLRWPTLSQGKPFFYDEDEAHHFNRIVNMVKARSLNPQYFHKPSLHFYLRMPAVVLGYLIENEPSPTRSLKNIRTHDNYGLARYSFSWSHPRVVLAVRAVSLVLTMLSCLLVFLVTRQLGATVATAVAATAIFSVSPELFHYSSFIGVDIPLMFFALLSTSLALTFRKQLTLKKLWLLGIVAGLAVSCKYNGLPIALLPLLLIIEARQLHSSRYLLAALVAPALGFFIGSPYILLSFPLFYQQLSYEIWHYAVAGHEGHSAEPGIAQVLHYGKWLCSDGVGVVATLFSLAGIAILGVRAPWRAAPFLLFPLLFFTLMSVQRANFVRNMIPILPYVAILAALFMEAVSEKLTRQQTRRLAAQTALCLGSVLLPLSATWDMRQSAISFMDSRIELQRWLQQDPGNEIAIQGDLQPPRELRALSGVSLVPPVKTLQEIYQDGADLLVTRSIAPPADATSDLLSARKEHEFPGTLSNARVLKSPAITVYRLQPVQVSDFKSLHSPPVQIAVGGPLGTAEETHLWISQRVTLLELEGLPLSTPTIRLRFSIMTPWKSQQFELIGLGWQQQVLLNQQNPGEWDTIEMVVPRSAFIDQKKIFLRLAKISSPATRGLSQDTRRLGIALRRVSLAGAD